MHEKRTMLTCAHCGTSFPYKQSGRKQHQFCTWACLQTSRTPEARFWSKVDQDGPPRRIARTWGRAGSGTGALFAMSGYGQFWLNDTNRRAHIVSYRWANGTTNGQQVQHLCNVRVCVRPSHLTLGTPAENMGYAVSMGRMAEEIAIGCDPVRHARPCTRRAQRQCQTDRRWRPGDQGEPLQRGGMRADRRKVRRLRCRCSRHQAGRELASRRVVSSLRLRGVPENNKRAGRGSLSDARHGVRHGNPKQATNRPIVRSCCQALYWTAPFESWMMAAKSTLMSSRIAMIPCDQSPTIALAAFADAVFSASNEPFRIASAGCRRCCPSPRRCRSTRTARSPPGSPGLEDELVRGRTQPTESGPQVLAHHDAVRRVAVGLDRRQDVVDVRRDVTPVPWVTVFDAAMAAVFRSSGQGAWLVDPEQDWLHRAPCRTFSSTFGRISAQRS